MVNSRSWLARYVAMILLILALLTIRLMQSLYNRRVISYRATGHFFRMARILRQRAKQFIASNNRFS